MDITYIRAVFGALRSTVTKPLYKIDSGVILQIAGITDLPEYFNTDFANSEKGTATRMLGHDGEVIIPDALLKTGLPIFCWIYVVNETTGRTVYSVKIPVKQRSNVEDPQPTPEQADIITQAINALNSAGDSAQQSASEAQTYAERAETASESAEASQESATQSATASQQSAEIASQSAQQAAESASNASQSATNASQSAQNAETAKGTAQQAATDAQTAQASAQESAQSAQQSAQSASQSAQSAESAKNTAVSTVDEFDSHAQQALDSVNQAGNNWKSLAQAKALDSEAYALGTRDGEDVGSSDPAYHNNAKYYAEHGGASAQTASNAAQTATQKASEAQASASAAAESARTLTIDSTLTQSGQAADSKVVGNKIDAIKALTIVTDETVVTTDVLNTLTWTSGYMGINGSTATASNLRYSNKISVSKGDVLDVLPTTTAFRFVCAFDGDTPVSASGAQNVNTYTVPDGIDGVVLTVYIPESSYRATGINYTTKEYTSKNIYEDDITDLTSSVNAVEEAVTVEQYQAETETDIIPTFSNGYMDTNGNVYDTGSSSYFDHTQKIPVQAGDEVSIWRDGNSYDIRFVCAFSGDTVVSASGWNNSGSAHSPYVVPEGIDGVVVSARDSYGINTIRVIHSESAKSAYVKPIPLGYMMEQGSLADGETLTLPHHNVKNENIYIFNANIDTFGKIKFSKESAFYVEVDGTNLYITNDATSYTIPHGISIANNVTLMVCNENSASVSLIRVSSDGQEFNYTTPTRFLMDIGSPTIQSIGSELTDCTFSWVSKNVNAPIWLFGDSYFSWYENRWTYYLARDGYTKNCLLNGYAGEASASAYSALINLLAATTPKTVVWCMGMNDGDSESTVNANWERYYNRLINLSKEYGFELVLYTVPTTPVINNKYKNAIIRDSGYRYIEADFAVRIDENGNWIPGALNEGTSENPDNVHPTPMGAKIIYYRVISDLPEIMCNR